MKFISISYFTDADGSDYYQKSAERLATTLDHLGLERDIQEIANRGSYRENCTFKPIFILRELLNLRYPLLWLDADSKLLRYPSDLVELPDNIDIALSTPDGNLARAKASPLLFNYCPKTLEFLCAWIDRIEIHRQQGNMTFDHEPLLEVLAEFQSQMRIWDVGAEYCIRDNYQNPRSVISMGISTSDSKSRELREMQQQERNVRVRHRRMRR